MKNNFLNGVSLSQVKEIEKQSKQFRTDLDYIYSGLIEIDEFLTMYCANNPHIVLIESLADIRDFINILESYKKKGIF